MLYYNTDYYPAKLNQSYTLTHFNYLYYIQQASYIQIHHYLKNNSQQIMDTIILH